MTVGDPGVRRGGAMAVYTLLVLTVVYCFAFVDRQILNMLVGPIKRDFAATDLQIGYLIGPAFILSFMAVGLPAGLAVDRVSRRNLVIGAGTVWSIGTAAAAFVDSLGALMATRALVGGAEAVLFPAGMSMIADLFDRRRLPVANSIFLAAPYLGGGMALITGGLVLGATEQIASIPVPGFGTIRGWQSTFVLIGIAGFLPVLLLATIREPVREGAAAGGEKRFTPAAGLRFVVSRWRFYGFFYLGMGAANLVMAMIAAWTPTLLARSFGLPAATVGWSYGIYVLIAGLAGGLSGPVINSWVSRRWKVSTMWTACLGPALILIFTALLFVVETAGATMICLAAFTFSYAFPLSLAGTSLQVVTPPPLRGTTSAIYLVFNSILGYALGPIMVPLVTGHVLHDAGRIGDAIQLIGLSCGTIALICLSMAARGYGRTMAAPAG